MPPPVSPFFGSVQPGANPVATADRGRQGGEGWRSSRSLGRDPADLPTRPAQDSLLVNLARLRDARDAAHRREGQGQELLPRERGERGRAPPAMPGAQVVGEPAPAECAPELERRSDREEGLAATRKLREREREQRPLADLVGAVVREQVE